MKYKSFTQKLISSIIALMYSCSAIQNPNNTTVQNDWRQQDYLLDASVPIIDMDVYNIEDATGHSSNLEDVRLPPIQVVDGRGINGEVIAPLRRGQQAPFDGVLFNGPALAYVEVEYRSQQNRCVIDRITELNRLRAQARTDISHLQVSYFTQQEIMRILLSGRDREITRLQNQLTQTIRASNNNTLPLILGTVGGLVGGFGLGFTIGHIAR